MDQRRALTVIALAACSFAAAPRSAEAEVLILTQLDAPLLSEEYAREEPVRELSLGFSLGAIVGYGLEISGDLLLAIEGGGGYTWSSDPYKRGTARLIVGARFGFEAGRLFPALYFHLGWGSSEGAEGDALLQRRGVLFDVGLSTIAAIAGPLCLGVRLGYQALVAGSGLETTHFFITGLELGVVL